MWVMNPTRVKMEGRVVASIKNKKYTQNFNVKAGRGMIILKRSEEDSVAI